MLEKKLNSWFRQMPEIGVFEKRVFDNCVFALGSDIGTVRKDNQDRTAAILVNVGAIPDRSFSAFVLCDGMGGMKDGAGSAATAMSAFISIMVLDRKLDVETRLKNAALGANEAVKKQNGGGSTLSAITIANERIFALNVGDSRIYSVNEDHRVKRHSQDDNLKDAFGGDDEGLLQYIGMGEGIRPHISEICNDFEFLFLTSDGVHNLETGVFDKVVLNSRTPTEICDRLIKTAVWTGGRDNASVIAISKNLLKSPLAEQNSAEICVWSPKGELPVLWADRPQELSDHRIEHQVEHQLEAQSDNGGAESVDRIGGDQFELEVARDNRSKSRKSRGKTPRKIKEGFGDLERDQDDN